MGGPDGGEGRAVDSRAVGIHARPFPDALDKRILHGIGQGVDHLLDDVVGLDEANDAGVFGGPEILEAAAECVLALGYVFVEVPDEVWVAPVWVEDARMMVVGGGVGEDDLDAESLGGHSEAI